MVSQKDELKELTDLAYVLIEQYDDLSDDQKNKIDGLLDDIESTIKEEGDQIA